MIIKNKAAILSHGNKDGRKIALNIIESALKAIDPYKAVRKTVFIDNNFLTVSQLRYDLSKTRNIYVVGVGKGTIRIATALEDILGNRITKGIIIEKRGQSQRLKIIKVVEGGHPLPDRKGLKHTKEIMEIAKIAQVGDLVFVCIAGGCSALMPLPVEGISLEEKKRVNDLLLKCGASIEEINAVRKHISAIKGGRLARFISPAEVISLIVVDEIAGRPWGPTVPDTTTFEDAIRVLTKYDLWKKVPDPIKNHLRKGLLDKRLETPKARDFESLKVRNLVLLNNNVVCEAARDTANQLGLNSVILSTVLEGESREAGVLLACIGKEVEVWNRPLKPPCVLIAGGETTVTILDDCGEGGRNQELALASSLKIGGSENIVIASIGTDGTDGPTDIAGAVVDGYTLNRAEEHGIDLFMHLKKHNSSYVFRLLNDAIITGPTGTNVMDLMLIIVTTQTSHTPQSSLIHK